MHIYFVITPRDSILRKLRYIIGYEFCDNYMQHSRPQSIRKRVSNISIDLRRKRRWKAYFMKYIRDDSLKIKYYDNTACIFYYKDIKNIM